MKAQSMALNFPLAKKEGGISSIKPHNRGGRSLFSLENDQSPLRNVLDEEARQRPAKKCNTHHHV